MMLVKNNLWWWMINEPLTTPWIVCGDFNKVENQEDKEGESTKRMLSYEKEAWRVLKACLRIYEPNII